MNMIYEEDGGVTQVSAVAPGQKIDVFGTNDKLNDNWYEQLLELKDYNNMNINNTTNTLFAGTVNSIINDMKKLLNEPSFSDRDIEMYKEIIKELSLYPKDKSVTILKGTDTLKFIFNTDIRG